MVSATIAYYKEIQGLVYIFINHLTKAIMKQLICIQGDEGVRNGQLGLPRPSMQIRPGVFHGPKILRESNHTL